MAKSQQGGSGSNVLPFQRKAAGDKHKGNTLCRRGFHAWQTNTERRFDVKAGKLLTEKVCKRCGERKVVLT